MRDVGPDGADAPPPAGAGAAPMVVRLVAAQPRNQPIEPRLQLFDVGVQPLPIGQQLAAISRVIGPKDSKE